MHATIFFSLLSCPGCIEMFFRTNEELYTSEKLADFSHGWIRLALFQFRYHSSREAGTNRPENHRFTTIFMSWTAVPPSKVSLKAPHTFATLPSLPLASNLLRITTFTVLLRRRPTFETKAPGWHVLSHTHKNLATVSSTRRNTARQNFCRT